MLAFYENTAKDGTQWDVREIPRNATSEGNGAKNATS